MHRGYEAYLNSGSAFRDALVAPRDNLLCGTLRISLSAQCGSGTGSPVGGMNELAPRRIANRASGRGAGRFDLTGQR